MKTIRSLIAAMAFAFAFGAGGPAIARDQAAPVTEQSAQPGTDAWISMHVKEQLTNTKELPANAISVATINGVVMLAGIVDTPDQVQKTIAIAKATQGVRSVDSTALNSRH